MTEPRPVSLYDRPLLERRPPITERLGPADLAVLVAANVCPDNRAQARQEVRTRAPETPPPAT